MNKIDLQNRSAVITGGAQGIGLAIAERLLMSGASVSLWDRDETLVKKTANTLASKGNVEYVVMDVTNLFNQVVRGPGFEPPPTHQHLQRISSVA